MAVAGTAGHIHPSAKPKVQFSSAEDDGRELHTKVSYNKYTKWVKVAIPTFTVLLIYLLKQQLPFIQRFLSKHNTMGCVEII